jgi:hypothetical protein
VGIKPLSEYELSLLFSTVLVTKQIGTFFQVSSHGEHANLTKVDEFWQQHWPTVVKTGDAGHLLGYGYFVPADVLM